MDDLQLAWPFLIPIVGTICTFAYIIVLTLSKARVRELEVRERIAMIERGLVPPPEVDPARLRSRHACLTSATRHRSPGRHRRAGVTLMGVGFGLDDADRRRRRRMNEGIGVGGFFVIMGLAFFINGLFDHPGRVSIRSAARPLADSGPDPTGAAAPRLAAEFRARYSAAIRIDTAPSRR